MSHPAHRGHVREGSCVGRLTLAGRTRRDAGRTASHLAALHTVWDRRAMELNENVGLDTSQVEDMRGGGGGTGSRCSSH